MYHHLISFFNQTDLQNFLLINKQTYSLTLGKSVLINCESYVNVILQLLCHTKELKLLDGDTSLIKSFKQLYKKMNEGNFIVSPKTFIKNTEIFKGKDPISFMMCLLDIFHTNGVSLNTNNCLINNKNILLQTSKLGKNSLISDIFYGQLMMHWVCHECEHTTYDFSTFKYLNFNFNNQLRFTYSYKPCKNCGDESKDVEHIQITYIYKLPKILILKNHTSEITDLKISIDLHQFSMEYITVYKLKGIVCKRHGGDYYIVLFTGLNWCLFEGKTVTNFDILNLKLNEIIILIYRQ